MSTKTTFKRIALVAVAALGLGVMSVAPSSAVPTGITVTVANGTAGLGATGGAADSSTAATVNIAGLLEATDSVTVEIVLKSYPTGAATPAGLVYLHNLDSATPTMSAYTVDTTTAGSAATAGTFPLVGTSTTAGLHTYAQGTIARISKATSAANISHNFGVQFDSSTATGRIAGTYTYTVLVKTFATGSSLPGTTTAKDVSIVIAAASTASDTASAAQTTAYIGAAGGTNTSDTAISAVATADATTDAEIDVTINNAAGGTGVADDSVTATITGAGTISFDDSTYGKSITHSVTAGVATISIRGDGTAGVGTIAITTKAGFSSTKTVTFYAKAASTLTTKLAPVSLVVGSNDSAVAVTATDATGTNWAGAAYIVASSAADALIGGSTTPVACVYNSSGKVHWCPVTAIAAGTAKFKVIDASTVALATATSAEFSLTVSTAPAATVKLEFDKATYQPYEKAYIKVSVLDAAGNRLGAKTYTNALASGGITTNIAFSGTAPTMTATDVAINALDGTDKFGGYLTYVAYMPAQGDVTITAKGGSGLPVSGQVAVTATASVVNDSVNAATDAANEATDAANAATDAALAAADAADAATAAAQDASDAVAALSASVSKMISNLRAQITSLTNLVIKIQKKVKA